MSILMRDRSYLLWVRLIAGVASLCTSSALAQDSIQFYYRLKEKAYKTRITRLAYDAVFVPPKQGSNKPPEAVEGDNANPFMEYEGKVIRSIYISVYDPFGISVNDTVPRKTNVLQAAGNHLHRKTDRHVISNRLLFHEKQRLEPLALSESERVLRQQTYVNDAKITVVETSHRDSVDVFVQVHDKWPITIPVEVTDMKANAKLRNANVLGTGHQLEQYIGYTRPDQVAFSGFYRVPNIGRSFASAQAAYQTDVNGTVANFNIDRPFYSPLARYAAGVNVYHSWREMKTTDTLTYKTTVYPVRTFGYDVYAMYALKPLTDRKFFNQSTNWIAGARVFQYVYTARPPSDVPLGDANTLAFLGNLGFSVQQYYKDRFIYRFGANEDVPEGLIMQFIYGGYKKDGAPFRFYNGIELARAAHFDHGYFSATLSYGVFYYPNVPNDETFNVQLDYFSDLIRLGRTHIRQFFKSKTVIGVNKMNGATTILSSDEIYGFDGSQLPGTKKSVFNSETVAYLPYQWLGFRFAPVLAVGLGVIGDDTRPISKSLLYQGYTLGVMFRNENLLTSTFQLSVGLYPFVPGGGSYVMKYNPITSFTLRLRAFSVSRPDFISY